MLPEILGVSVPEAYQEKVPPVNKLTLLQSNKTLREDDEVKRNAAENCVLEEKMDTQCTRKTKRKQRRKNGRGSAARMEEEGSQDKKGFEDEAEDCGVKMEVSQKIIRTQRRRKKEENHMDISQTNDT